MELKGLLKDLHIPAYRDKNYLINTNYWKINFLLKTFIAKYETNQVPTNKVS